MNGFRLSYEMIFALPLIIHLSLLLIVTLYYGARHPVKVPSKKANIYRCTNCSYVYVNTRRIPLAKCPRCKRLNEAVKR